MLNYLNGAIYTFLFFKVFKLFTPSTKNGIIKRNNYGVSIRNWKFTTFESKQIMYTEIVVSNAYYQIKKHFFREVLISKLSHPSTIVHYPWNDNNYFFAIPLIENNICLDFCLLRRNLTLLHYQKKIVKEH